MQLQVNRLLITAVVVLTVFSFIAPVTAQSQDQSLSSNTVSLTCGETDVSVPLSDVKEMYNNNTEQVPAILQPAITSNTTVIEVTGADNPHYTLRTGEGSLQATTLTATKADDPDVIVQVEKSVVCKLPQSSDPVKTLTDAHEDGALKIEAKSTVDKAKVFVVEKLIDLASYI